jgi:hypothetical protein
MLHLRVFHLLFLLQLVVAQQTGQINWEKQSATWDIGDRRHALAVTNSQFTGLFPASTYNWISSELISGSCTSRLNIVNIYSNLSSSSPDYKDRIDVAPFKDVRINYIETPTGDHFLGAFAFECQVKTRVYRLKVTGSPCKQSLDNRAILLLCHSYMSYEIV